MVFKNLDYKKTALSIAACGVALGLHMGSKAQTNSDSSLSIGGQVAESTCLLVTARGSSEQIGGVRTYKLNTTNTDSANLKNVDETVGSVNYAITISLIGADGSACNLPGTWDVGLNVTSADYVTTPSGRTYLISKGPNSPENVGLVLLSTGSGTGLGRLSVDFSKSVQPYGVLLSNRPNMAFGLSTNQTISLKPELVRTSASAITAGDFSLSLPLNIWYK